jgi:hypothetical protein
MREGSGMGSASARKYVAFHFYHFSFAKVTSSPPLTGEGANVRGMVLRTASSSRNETEDAMSTKNINRNKQQISNQKLIVGLQKHEQSLSSLVIGGTSYKTSDVIAVVQTLVNSAQTVVSSRATWQASIVADDNAQAKNKTFMSGLRQSLLVAFGSSVDVLADFGMTPHKTRAARTPEEKAEATAKAKATRAARHTMGKKQKAQIKGSVASPVPGDVTKTPATPAAPATPIAPAPAVAPGVATPHTGS